MEYIVPFVQVAGAIAVVYSAVVLAGKQRKQAERIHLLTNDMVVQEKLLAAVILILEDEHAIGLTLRAVSDRAKQLIDNDKTTRGKNQ